MEKYSAGIVKKPTFLRESIEVAALINQGLERHEVKSKLLSENILKITPQRRNVEISSAVLTRLSQLTSDQIQLMCNGSLEDRKQVVLLSILKSERLLRDFMNEVYLEKLYMSQRTLNDADINLFFNHKAETDDDVAKWKDVTIKKIKQVIKKILKELGYLEINGKAALITPPIISDRFLKVLSGEDADIRRIFTGR